VCPCGCSVTKLKASLQLDPEQFTAQFSAAKPAKDDQNIVFYGFSSVKSTAAVEIAHKLGFKKYELYDVICSVSRCYMSYAQFSNLSTGFYNFISKF